MASKSRSKSRLHNSRRDDRNYNPAKHGSGRKSFTISSIRVGSQKAYKLMLEWWGVIILGGIVAFLALYDRG